MANTQPFADAKSLPWHEGIDLIGALVATLEPPERVMDDDALKTMLSQRLARHRANLSRTLTTEQVQARVEGRLNELHRTRSA
jgi:putative addiction module component (TIGR02574 family)